MPVVTKDLIPSLSRQGLHTVDSMFVSVKLKENSFTVVLIHRDVTMKSHLIKKGGKGTKTSCILFSLISNNKLYGD